MHHCRIAKLVKSRDSRTPVILGGPVPTAIPEIRSWTNLIATELFEAKANIAILRVMRNLRQDPLLLTTKFPEPPIGIETAVLGHESDRAH